MTKREFLMGVANLVSGNVEFTGEQMVELGNFAQAEIEKMDTRNATPTKAQRENAELAAKIIAEFMTAEPQASVELAEKAGITVNKLNGLMRAQVANGTVVKSQVTLEKRPLVAYALAQ